MSDVSEIILQSLRQVAGERARRAQQPALALGVQQVKAFQHARFMHTYADLLKQSRYAAATRFFLEDLYGPGDFTRRDDEFVRIVPALVRIFKREIVGTVRDLAQLHALSEVLDSAMAEKLGVAALDGQRYGELWREIGRPEQREQQIRLMLGVGASLDGYTRSAFLRTTLRLMRGPAHAAGLGELQEFLERGFDTFRQMRGADEFLQIIASRERALAEGLFSGRAVVSPLSADHLKASD